MLLLKTNIKIKYESLYISEFFEERKYTANRKTNKNVFPQND